MAIKVTDTSTTMDKIKLAASDAADSISSAASSIGSAASGAASSLLSSAGGAANTLLGKASAATGNITGAAKKAFNDTSGLVEKQTTTDKKLVALWTKTGKDSNFAGELFNIGRPCRFNETVDKYQRFGNYLRAKMSVVDLIPVDYGMDLKRLSGIIGGTEKEKDGTSTQSIFSVTYDYNIKVFQRLCEWHGLSGVDCEDSNIYAGIRLFTTDDTTTNDTISVQYKDSTFQGLSDGMSSWGQKYRDFATSFLGTAATEFTDTTIARGVVAAKEVSKKFSDNPAIADLVGGLASVAGDMILKGNKMTFPKIWQSTTYAGNLSVNIRLVSPYGHPAAVKEFIIKPLLYLIILSAPQTPNGITYGGGIPITIKAYGLNYTVLGSIASMTFRRGGSDTSFNLYRQPLTVDVSIQFQTLFDAFAVFDPRDGNNSVRMDEDIFSDDMLTEPDDLEMYAKENKNHLMVSLGTILASFRPVRIVDTQMNPQIYGSFTPPNRTEIPDAPAFTPLTGNLGSTISGAVSSIGKFASMITNGPGLIQQGLANAVYNTAKGSVGTIAKTASDWIGKPAAFADSVRNKIGNLF